MILLSVMRKNIQVEKSYLIRNKNNRILREHEAKFFVSLPRGVCLPVLVQARLKTLNKGRAANVCLLLVILNNYHSKISRKYLFAFGNINNNCYSNTLNKGIAANVCLPLVKLITIIIAKL